MMKKIKTPYFPAALRYAAPLPAALAVYLLANGFAIWACAVALLSMILLTTNYVTEINVHEKECRDFLSFLGMPLQEETLKFQKVNKIVITKERPSQMANTRSRSRQLDLSTFTGTVLFYESKTLTLLTRTDKKDLITSLQEFADLLNVNIVYHTTKEHFIIDPGKY